MTLTTAVVVEEILAIVLVQELIFSMIESQNLYSKVSHIDYIYKLHIELVLFLVETAPICYFQCAIIISGFTNLIYLQGGLIVGLLAWAGVRNWRTLMLVCSAPTGLIALLWFAIPESPRWLIAKGQWTLIPT